ncbi:retrovirus-related pol polyprotein from transposon TNT 1-94 [Tanacetum coccineum]
MAKATKPPLTFDELMHTPIDFSAFVMNCLKIDNLTKEILVGPAYNLLKGTCKSYVELDYTMEECYRAFNDKKYTTFTTKSKAARYKLKAIEDMVPNLWSPIKHDVYSTKRILSIISVKVNEWCGYSHLEEIVVKRAYRQLYTFKEGDFKRLHLNDIEDMLLLIVQNKLNNLDGNVVVHLAASLRMFARRTVIQSRVKDLQLGVERYQKKLNFTKPRTRDVDMSRRPAYTTLSNPQDVPVMRMASVAAKPCQGDSSEFYLITCSIYTDQRRIVVIATVFDEDQEKYEHVSLKVTSTQDGKISQDDDSRLYLVDDLKEAQVHIEVKLKGTSSGLKSKDRYAYHKLKEKIQDHEQRLKTFIECLNHNLFSVGQFCDAELEVAFRKSTCFVRDLQGNDLLTEDCSRYTWTLFLRSKDETPEVLKDFLTMIQRNLQAPVISVRSERGTEFLNKTLNAFFKEEGIEHQTSTPRTPKQNGVVERRNRTLVEADRTMLSASKIPLFDEIKEMSETSVANDTSGLVPQRQKVSDYDNSDPAPQLQNVFPSANTTT